MTSLIFNPTLTTLWRGDIPASIRLVTSRAFTIARCSWTYCPASGIEGITMPIRILKSSHCTSKTPDMLDPSDHGQSMYKYWCGICWRWIREGKQDFRTVK
jgi:hypothetical protein